MKVSTKSVTRATQAILRRRSRQTKLINPGRDWLIGFFVGVLILVAIPTWSAYMYLTNRHSNIQPDTQLADEVPVYHAASVDEALQYFATRRELFIALRKETVAPDVLPALATSTQPVPQTTTGTSPEIVDNAAKFPVESTDVTTLPTPTPVFR